MQTCKKCGVENSDHAKYCKKCGQGLSLKICPNCHKENDPDAQFCQECGKSLVDLSKSVATPETIFEPESENQKESNEPAQDKIKPTVEKTQSQEPKPLRAVYFPSLLFGLVMALFISILKVVSGPYNSNDLFFTGISNVFIYGAIYSLFILIWRRYYKKTVDSIKNPDSGLKAFLIHISCIITLMLFMVFSLLGPLFGHIGQSPQSNIKRSTPIPTYTSETIIGSAAFTHIHTNNPAQFTL
jgi:ribosomal protein L40E